MEAVRSGRATVTSLAVVVCVAFDHRAPVAGLQKFKNCICACERVDLVLEVSGTYDMIVQAHLASLADYADEMQRLAPQLAEFALKVETNFVARKVERSAREKCLWVPCNEGRRRVDTTSINKILAEGDYMRLCLSDSECLVHDTIRHLLSQLEEEQFIQVHRSAVLRVAFIDRLVHRGRRWIARLKDGSEQPVAKSHVAEVLRRISDDSSPAEARSPKLRLISEQ